MNRHGKDDLRQMQSLPLEAKILMTQRRIRDWVDYWNGDVYVSFSGGKDSTVLKHIVDGMYDDVPAVFVNTGLEYPEIQTFVREVKAGKYNCFNSDVEILRPEMRFDEVIQKYGYPVISKEVAYKVSNVVKKNGEISDFYMQFFNGEYLAPDGTKSPYNIERWKFLLDAPFRVSAKCCDVMKKNPVKNMGRKRDGKRLLPLWRKRAGKGKPNGLNSAVMHMTRKTLHQSRYPFGRNKTSCTTSSNSTFLTARYTVTFM